MTDVVGTLTVPEGKVARINSEYAAWGTDVDLVPGVYPVELRQYASRHYLAADLPAIITHEDNAPHFGGMPIGPSSQRRIGQPTTYHWTTDTYALANALLTGWDGPTLGKLTLNPDVEPAAITFESWQPCSEAMGHGYDKDADGKRIELHDHAVQWHHGRTTADRDAGYAAVKACPLSAMIDRHTTDLMVGGELVR
jgi:hypothetical protein